MSEDICPCCGTVCGESYATGGGYGCACDVEADEDGWLCKTHGTEND